MNERSLFRREHALVEDRRDAGVALARSILRASYAERRPAAEATG